MTPGLSALVVANAADSDPGHVGERLEQRGFRLRTTLREDGGVAGIVDSVRSVDVVVLLGSEWSVHSPVDTAALKAECALVRSAMAAGIPVLAICYGAQVVAAACGGVVERAAKDVGGFLVCLGEEVGVDVQRRSGVAMPEPAGDGSDVDAGGKQASGDVVTQVMKTNAGQACALAQPCKGSTHRVGVPRLRSVRCMAEHECAWF